MLHQVGVLFDLYYDARKHKIKMSHCMMMIIFGFFPFLCVCVCVKLYFVLSIKGCDQSLENKINKIFIVLKDAIHIYKALAV